MESRHRHRGWQLAAAVAFAVSAWAPFGTSQPQAKEQALTDASGNKLIRGFKEVVFEIKSPGKISFDGYGSPISGTFKSQGIELETNQIKGLVASVNRTYRLDSATLEGAVRVLVTRPSASQKAGAVQQIELKTPKAVYASATETWTLSGPLQLHRTDKPADEDMTLKGNSGNVTLYGADRPKTSETGIKTARVEQGSLNLVTSRREPIDGKPGQFETKRYRLDGTADEIAFDDGKREIRFTGNVHFTGDDPLVFSDMTADSAVITLDERGQPVRIKLGGDPGVTKIDIKKAGSGGGSANRGRRK